MHRFRNIRSMKNYVKTFSFVLNNQTVQTVRLNFALDKNNNKYYCIKYSTKMKAEKGLNNSMHWLQYNQKFAKFLLKFFCF